MPVNPACIFFMLTKSFRPLLYEMGSKIKKNLIIPDIISNFALESEGMNKIFNLGVP